MRKFTQGIGVRVVGVFGLALTSGLAGTGCSSESAREPQALATDEGTSLSQEIIGAQRDASAYTEAVLINVQNNWSDYCTGVLVAPKVVLTAAHCVAFNPVGVNPGTWTVTTRDGQVATTAAFAIMDAAKWATYARGSYETHLAEARDVALLFLTDAFTGVSYPTFSATTYPIGSSTPMVSAIGRMEQLPTSTLVLSGQQPLSAGGATYGTYATKTTRLTGAGDSGGPLFLEGTHTLVGIESHFDEGATLDYWTRLDGAVYTFIRSNVESHGSVPVSITGFRDAVSDLLCARVASCCDGGGGYTLNSTACHKIYNQLGFENTAHEIGEANAANVNVGTAAMQECLDGIGAATSGCNSGSVAVKAAVTKCIAAVIGNVATGGLCNSSLECQAGVCAKSGFGNGGATCQALKAAGASCQVVDTAKYPTPEQRDVAAQDLCSRRGSGDSGRFCDAYNFGAGAYRNELLWTCKAVGGIGADCNSDQYCGSMVCMPFGGAGEYKCASNAPFVTPTVCTAFAQ